jgi:heat shock protein HtpX
LRKISGAVEQVSNPTAERNPASAPLFIINPLSGGGIDNLFSTHPNVENRIARLNEMARQMDRLQSPPRTTARSL